MVLIKKLFHITFPVSDLKRAVNFYENVLGLKKTGDGQTTRLLTSEGYSLVLNPVASWKSLSSSMKLTKPIKNLRQKASSSLQSPRICIGVRGQLR